MKKQVVKRSTKKQDFDLGKTRARISKCAKELSIDLQFLAETIERGLSREIQTNDLEKYIQETIAYSATKHPDYLILAGRLVATDLQKKASSTFSGAMERLYKNLHPVIGENPLISDAVYSITMKNKELIDSKIVHSRDLDFDYFALTTLMRGYLQMSNGKVEETPQYMYMRVALGIHGEDLESAFVTYENLSLGMFTHATPTLFHAGTPKPQLSSCFLVQMKDDSIDGIYDTLKICAMVSKYAGGIGLSIHNIRAAKSYIKGSNGESNGIVPMLRVFNDTARYVDQGGGKRKGSFAVYLEPWHSDIQEFLELKKNTGKEENRARDLFYALWIPDLFMKRVKENGNWSLFCPNECKGLPDVWGEEFETLYTKYEKEGKARKTIKAQTLWFQILESQVETGTPYIMYKDACNRKSNQQNLGTIKSSNLCTEIVQYTSKDEVAVCNLASIALPKFVEDGKFNHDKLFLATSVVTKNLNKVIDINFYPVKEAETSNRKHRPIGIGVQGLAETLFKLNLPFESEEAAKLNKDIFETIYFAALITSNGLAKTFGTYDSYEGSPVSKGILQYDMWNVTPSDRWNWDSLKKEIKKYGIRNSLLLAPMPTASTAQILGNTEGSEPITSNIYLRRVLSGEFPVINRYLVEDLTKIGLWEPAIINKIIANGGSIQKIGEIPKELKNLYKTVWEIKQRTIIDMAADRGAFIDQSQSMNVFIAEPSVSKLTSMHFYAWEKGLKTGMYYLRTKPAANPIQFTVEKTGVVEKVKTKNPVKQCQDSDTCLLCSS